MAMRLAERVKPLLLATLLTFMVGSYFVSDTFTRGAPVERHFHPKIIADIICEPRPKKEHAACGASVAEALAPTNLACMAPMRDVFVCENPTKGTKKGKKNSCQEETKRQYNCLQVHLEPQLQRRGFSNEEIARLGLGYQDLTKQHPTPPGGGEEEGQGGEGQGSEGDAAGGKKSEVVPEAGGDEGGAEPKVEVVEGPKDSGGGIAR